MNLLKWKDFSNLNEDIKNKSEVIEWLKSNNILNKDSISKEDCINIIEFFLKKNRTIIEKTALSDCHVKGLSSFILNYNPKIRLFICEPDCELFEKYNPKNPIIPIHPHKYDDLFFQVSGKLVHHLYEKKRGGGIFMNKYNFIRLNNIDNEIVNLGEEELKYIGDFTNINKLKSRTLHSASVKGYYPSWIIIETNQDDMFSEVLYHKNLKKREDLYNVIINPVKYIEDFIDKVS